MSFLASWLILSSCYDVKIKLASNNIVCLVVISAKP